MSINLDIKEIATMIAMSYQGLGKEVDVQEAEVVQTIALVSIAEDLHDIAEHLHELVDLLNQR